MKKKLGLLLPVLMLLASCGEADYTGTYAFQLGKSNSTHIGIYMNLTKEVSSSGKKFELKFDIGKEVSAQGSSLKGAEGVDLDKLNDLFADGLTFTGYYIVDDSDAKAKQKRVYLGVNLLDQLFKDSEITIPSSLLEKFVYANIESNVLNLDFPISADDMLYQLYWYGYRVDTTDILPYIEELDTKHDVGTHPSEDDVLAIREAEKTRETPNDFYTQFRDFHILEMGLVKAD